MNRLFRLVFFGFLFFTFIVVVFFLIYPAEAIKITYTFIGIQGGAGAASSDTLDKCLDGRAKCGGQCCAPAEDCDGAACKSRCLEHEQWSGSRCVECLNGGDCAINEECVNNRCESRCTFPEIWDGTICVACLNDNHCAANEFCNAAGSCEPQCVSSAVWDGTACVECLNDNHCAANELCDAAGSCVQQCVLPFVWNGTACVECLNDSHCAANEFCNAEGSCERQCVSPTVWNGTACVACLSDNHCTVSEICNVMGSCEPRCKAPFVWSGIACTCPVGTVEIGNTCCPAGAIWSNEADRCVQCEQDTPCQTTFGLAYCAKPAYECQCLSTTIWDEETERCICTAAEHWSDDLGICTECLDDTHCTADQYCDTGVCLPRCEFWDWDALICVSCLVDADCGDSALWCSDGSCITRCESPFIWDGTACACPADQVEIGGYCCSLSQACPGCRPDQIAGPGRCECPYGKFEDNGLCCESSLHNNGTACVACANDMHCAAEELCDKESWTCQPRCYDPFSWNGVECACPEGQHSDGNNCFECLNDSHCAHKGSGWYCDNLLDFQCKVCSGGRLWNSTTMKCECPADKPQWVEATGMCVSCKNYFPELETGFNTKTQKCCTEGERFDGNNCICDGFYNLSASACYPCNYSAKVETRSTFCHMCPNRFFDAIGRGCYPCNYPSDVGQDVNLSGDGPDIIDECNRCPNRVWYTSGIVYCSLHGNV